MSKSPQTTNGDGFKVDKFKHVKRLFDTCFIQFCVQLEKWVWFFIIPMKRNHRNLRMFQKQAKQN